MQYIKEWKVSYVCDRCKDIFEYSPIVITMNNDEMDLCKDCAKSLKKWMYPEYLRRSKNESPESV